MSSASKQTGRTTKQPMQNAFNWDFTRNRPELKCNAIKYKLSSQRYQNCSLYRLICSWVFVVLNFKATKKYKYVTLLGKLMMMSSDQTDSCIKMIEYLHIVRIKHQLELHRLVLILLVGLVVMLSISPRPQKKINSIQINKYEDYLRACLSPFQLLYSHTLNHKDANSQTRHRGW